MSQKISVPLLFPSPALSPAQVLLTQPDLSLRDFITVVLRSRCASFNSGTAESIRSEFPNPWKLAAAELREGLLLGEILLRYPTLGSGISEYVFFGEQNNPFLLSQFWGLVDL